MSIETIAMNHPAVSSEDLEHVVGGQNPSGPDGLRPIANPLRNPRQSLDDLDKNLEHINGDAGRITGEVLGTETGASYLERIAEKAYDYLSPVSWANYFVNGR